MSVCVEPQIASTAASLHTLHFRLCVTLRASVCVSDSVIVTKMRALKLRD